MNFTNDFIAVLVFHLWITWYSNDSLIYNVTDSCSSRQSQNMHFICCHLIDRLFMIFFDQKWYFRAWDLSTSYHAYPFSNHQCSRALKNLMYNATRRHSMPSVYLLFILDASIDVTIECIARISILLEIRIEDYWTR